MTSPLRTLATLAMLALAAAGAGCGVDPGDADEDADEEGEVTSAAGELTVFGASSRSCSTSSVRGLAEQLVEEMKCVKPDVLTRIDTSGNLSVDPEVFPYLQTPAARALRAAATAYGKPMTLSSALRTLPQQYLLRRWDVRNRCGIRIAASVGESNHEPGLAIDVRSTGSAAENKALRGVLDRNGFTWIGAHDPVHYDFEAGGEDLGKVSVIAFKRLWNRNHPDKQVAVDDVYDAATELKLKNAPANGFRTGARCDGR